MPAKPLTTEQKQDAKRLKDAFQAWQDAMRRNGTPMSQEKAADKLGFGQSALNQYLNGLIPLNAPALVKLAELLDVKPEAISPAIVAQEQERSQTWGAAESVIEQLAVEAFILQLVDQAELGEPRERGDHVLESVHVTRTPSAVRPCSPSP